MPFFSGAGSTSVELFFRKKKITFLIHIIAKGRMGVGVDGVYNIWHKQCITRDVVLIEELNAPRGFWQMGVISKVDKHQALALVKCIDGTVYRSIRQLYPLEVVNETTVAQMVPYPRHSHQPTAQ